MALSPDASSLSAPSYGVLAADVEHEIEIKRSRFICYLGRVEAEDEARAFIELVRQEHRTARHHCSAFVIGANRQLQRSNDDGEPSGTAGAPMLEALTGFVRPGSELADVSDVIAVVVRYFGGILLGTGGLVRAYSDSVSEALQQARFATRTRIRTYDVTAPLDAAGRWENELRAAGLTVLATDYSELDTRLTVGVPDAPEPVAEFETRLAALSQGAAAPVLNGTEWTDLSN